MDVFLPFALYIGHSFACDGEAEALQAVVETEAGRDPNFINNRI